MEPFMKSNTTKLKIIFILSLPTFFMLIFFFINNLYHLNSYRSLLISNYTTELNSFLATTEKEMDTLITNIQSISTHSEVSELFQETQKPTKSTSVLSILNQAKNMSSLIDTVIIYNCLGDFVITSSGIYDAEVYFDSIYSYEKYPYSYWKDASFSNGSTLFLSASAQNSDSPSAIGANVVVPLITVPIEGHTNFFIICQISINELLSRFENYKLTSNTDLYLIDNSTSDVYSNQSLHTYDQDAQLIKTLEKSLFTQTSIIKMNKEKYLSISSTQRSQFFGFRYVLSIPYSDISRSTYDIQLTVFVFMVVLSVILILYLIYGSKFLYLPWHNIATVAKQLNPKDSDSVPSNLENYILNSFETLSSSNQKLTKDLNSFRFMRQKKYLNNLLNNTSVPEVPEDLSFDFPYFAAVSVSISINPFFSETSNRTPRELCSIIWQSIYRFFSDNIPSYDLSLSENAFSMILNLKDNDTSHELIENCISQVQNLFTYDIDNIEITFAISDIYDNLDHFKTMFKQSRTLLAEKLSSTKPRFSTFQKETYYSSNQVSLLTDYITTQNFQLAEELLASIYEEISPLSLKKKSQIYNEIVVTLKNIINQHDIVIANSSADLIIELLKTQNANDSDIQGYIHNMLDAIEEQFKLNSTKVDIVSIIKYIDQHYTEDLSLDELAELYQTSAKYLSKRIKQYLNTPFKEYLTQLRINKAKEYLENTDITITELYAAVGFQNRNTFTRAFKLKVGLSATEYRNAHQSTVISDKKSEDNE